MEDSERMRVIGHHDSLFEGRLPFDEIYGKRRNGTAEDIVNRRDSKTLGTRLKRLNFVRHVNSLKVASLFPKQSQVTIKDGGRRERRR